MTLYVSNTLTATPAPVSASPAASRTWQWFRGGTAITGANSSSYVVQTDDIGFDLLVQQIETNFRGVARADSTSLGPVAAFNNLALFEANEPGVWYDPSDLTTLFQDAAGTNPVTTPGQKVGLMLDKRLGLEFGPELVVNGGFDTDTGWTKGTGWTIADGVASHVAGASGALTASGTATTIGKFYTLTFDLTVSAGVLNVSCGGFTTPNLGASGSFSYVFLASLSNFAVPFAAGTFAGTIDNISVRELPGFHATQSNTSFQPQYGIVPKTGRRNLLTFSEDPTNAAWVKNSVTATVDASAVTPLGNSSVRINALAGNANYYPQTVAVLNSFVTCWSVVRKGSSATTGNRFRIRNDTAFTNPLEFTVDYDTLEVTYLTGSSGATVTDLGDDWRLVVATAPWTSGNVCRWNPGFSGQASAGTEFIYHSNSQVEPGSTATAYQKVTTALDVTEAGVTSLGYLYFDGVDDFMVTPTITPGTDKVQVFAGLRKLSDAALGIVFEHSATLDTNNGSFYLAAPVAAGTPNYQFRSKGTTSVGVGANIAAPVTNIITAFADIAGDNAVFRVDGTQTSQGTGDQGTGNYLAYPMYIGRRGGTSLPFKGDLYQILTRFGSNLSTSTIEAVEAQIGNLTPENI